MNCDSPGSIALGLMTAWTAPYAANMTATVTSNTAINTAGCAANPMLGGVVVTLDPSKTVLGAATVPVASLTGIGGVVTYCPHCTPTTAGHASTCPLAPKPYASPTPAEPANEDDAFWRGFRTGAEWQRTRGA